MKNQMIIALGIALTIVVSNSPIQAAEGEKAPTQRKTIQQNMLAKYDANKNGALDPEEKAEIKKARDSKREEMLQKFDANKDGKLSKEERASARSSSRKSSKKDS
jgi:Ca2+-binding EF-hand superfamily protein